MRLVAAAMASMGLAACTVAEPSGRSSPRDTTTVADTGGETDAVAVDVGTDAFDATGDAVDDAIDDAGSDVGDASEATTDGAETAAETLEDIGVESSDGIASDSDDATGTETDSVDAFDAPGTEDLVDANDGDASGEVTLADIAPDGDTTVAMDTAPVDAAPTCTTTFRSYVPLPSPHVANCSAVIYEQNPPTSGPHYFAWAAYKRYALPVPRANYVHDLEHGGVVVLYHCPDEDCTADVDAVAEALDARPADPRCTATVKHRFVLTPDPLLPDGVRLAAVAWGHAMTSDCFDLESLGAFIDAYYAHTTEDSCSDGQDPTDPDSPIYCPETPP